MTDRTLLTELQDILGSNALSLPADSDLTRHTADFLGRRQQGAVPLAVAYPSTTQQVSAVMHCCFRHDQPVVVQGGLTGLVAGAQPESGELVLSLERMRAIEEIDAAAATMTLQAGVTLQAAQSRAAAAGFMFPIDMGSRGSCTIGGNVATNAGGNRVLRYGMARESVLGIEVVLADGTVCGTLNKMLKNNAGYDLKQLFIGSEGTLGIVTRVVFRLYPAPGESSAALAAVPDYAAAVALLQLARAMLGPTLSAFELMWPEYYASATTGMARRAPLPVTSGMVVLLDMLGVATATDDGRFQRLLERAMEQGIATDCAIAQSGRDCEAFWAIREAIGEMQQVHGRFVAFDVSVPVSDIGGFVESCRLRLRNQLPQVKSLAFGHIADGNVHVACFAPELVTIEAEISRQVYLVVRDWHGSVSAEHGIGLDKKQYLAYSRTEPEMALMRQLKRLLDPKSLLNRGRVI